MTTTTRVNPHREDALTADTVRTGMYFACWHVDGTGPAKYYTAVSTPFHDDNGYMVIQVRDRHGRTLDLSTGDLGLTACPHNGEWIAIAIFMDPLSPG